VPSKASVGVKYEAVYKAYIQVFVFGYACVMESEKAEAMYRAGLIPMKEFARAIMPQSEKYKRRFSCDACDLPELNFKHLFGRGPNKQAEFSEHIRRVASDSGYAADINSSIDSPEYNESVWTRATERPEGGLGCPPRRVKLKLQRQQARSRHR